MTAMTDHSYSAAYNGSGGVGGANSGSSSYHWAHAERHQGQNQGQSRNDLAQHDRPRQDSVFEDALDDSDQWADASSTYQQYEQQQAQYTPNMHGANGTPDRQRAHAASMTSSLRGKRAPPPAALALSPPSAREHERARQDSFSLAEAANTGRGKDAGAAAGGGNQYTGLGLGMPGYATGEKRVVTDSALDVSLSRYSVAFSVARCTDCQWARPVAPMSGSDQLTSSAALPDLFPIHLQNAIARSNFRSLTDKIPSTLHAHT